MDLRKDVLYYDALVDFPAIGQEDKLYLNKADGSLYYWDGAAYQLAGDGSGGVTSVTASAPLASSGGATPNITLSVPSDNTKFLDGTGAFDTVKDSDLSLSDITTNDVSTSKHGFAPKAPNDTTKFLRGDGTWAVPAAGSSSGKFGIADSTGAYTFYSTLQAAITAASSGQTVEMFTDITETSATTITLKDGVNINGNGHTYILNNTGTSSCLSDNGVAVTTSIINLNLRRIGATTASGTNTTCLLITGGSRIDFTGSTAYGSNSVSVIINNSSAKVSNVYAYGDTGANAALTVYVTAGKLENSVVYNNANNPAYYVYGLQNLGTIINCTVYSTSGYYAIYNQGEMIDCIGYSTANAPYGGGIKNESTAIGCTGYASGGAGFYAYVNTLNKNCNGYSSGAVGFTVNGSVNCKLINCTAFSAASYAFYAYNAFVQNCTGWSTANYAIYASNAGDGYGNISNGTFTSDASATIFSNTSNNSVISNNTIVSRYNAATGHSIVLGATVFGTAPLVDVLNNTLIVANASANCIYSASAYTIKYASNVFKNATTAVNANITQGISNSADTKGNILI